MKSKNNHIFIIISDTGKGISAGDLKNIFNPYFTTKKNGTGLGLAIAHKIVETHQGLIKGVEIDT
ncbi:ATP-binding protein [Desulfobacula sp.]